MHSSFSPEAGPFGFWLQIRSDLFRLWVDSFVCHRHLNLERLFLLCCVISLHRYDNLLESWVVVTTRALCHFLTITKSCFYHFDLHDPDPTSNEAENRHSASKIYWIIVQKADKQKTRSDSIKKDIIFSVANTFWSVKIWSIKNVKIYFFGRMWTFIKGMRFNLYSSFSPFTGGFAVSTSRTSTEACCAPVCFLWVWFLGGVLCLGQFLEKIFRFGSFSVL